MVMLSEKCTYFNQTDNDIAKNTEMLREFRNRSLSFRINRDDRVQIPHTRMRTIHRTVSSTPFGAQGRNTKCYIIYSSQLKIKFKKKKKYFINIINIPKTIKTRPIIYTSYTKEKICFISLKGQGLNEWMGYVWMENWQI